MNATAAICKAFLDGEVLTIKTCFKDFGVTNLPREVGRQVERKFGVTISKVRKHGKSRFGIDATWYEYRLNKSQHNMEGISKMEEYVKEHYNITIRGTTNTGIKRGTSSISLFN
jgi:hypothetical protein